MRPALRNLLCLVAALALALTWAPAAHAQGVTTGAISGIVAGPDGALLPGVTVTATHNPTGTTYVVTTNAEGRFTIANARTGGPYTVRAELEGFKAEEQTDLFVNLGQETPVAFEVDLGEVAETVTVVGEAYSLFSPSRTGAASNVTAVDIETLPTLKRGIEDFARTNPFVNITSQNEDPDSISVAGRNNRYNNIQIDGSVNNDLFGLAATGTPGGQANTTPISLDAISELQVVIADYDVRQGGFSGGSVNAITRSGTNDYKGSVFYFTRDDSYVGDGPDALGGEIGTFEDDKYGFRIGGPISRDKIFFFANAEIGDGKTPTGWTISGGGGQQFRGGAAVGRAEEFRNILNSQYGFDPGGLSQNVLETPSDKYFGRLDFNVAANHQATLRHNYVDATNDINRPSSSVYEWPSESYFFSTETNSSVGQLNSVLGSTMFNELRLAYQTIKDRRIGRDGVTFPWIEIEDIFDDNTNFEFEAGTEPFSTRNALDQDIIELTDDFTWIHGDHNFVIGTHNEFFTFDNLFIQNAFGAYEFDSLDDLAAGLARRYQVTVVNPGQAPSQQFDVNQIGIYAGDRWQFRSNLSLTYGLRLDIPYFPDQPSRNPQTETLYGFRTDELPDGEQLWQPRLGFNWDIGGTARQQLRGGAGVFAGRTPYVWISNAYARTGIEQSFITVQQGATVPPIPFNPDPFNQPTNFPGAGVGEFNLIDPNFKFPQVLRFNLGYDRELPWWNLVGSIEAIYSDTLKDIDYRNVNLRQVGTAFDGRPVYAEIVRSGGAYLITNTSEGESTNLAVKLEKPYGRGVWGYLTYVYGDAESVNDGTSSRAISNWQFNEAIDPNHAEVGTTDFQVEHRLTASLSYQFNRDSRWPTTLSAYYNLQSGRPFSFLIGDGASPFDSVNGDFFTSNDLLYVPASASDVVIEGGGTFAQLDAFIGMFDCLSSHRGGIAPRNCGEAPWSHTLDLHIAQDIPIANTSLQVTFDVLNAMNLFDDDTGTLNFVPFNTVTVADFLGTTADGTPRYRLRPVVTSPATTPVFDQHNINSRWRAQLGLRWTF